ncbi:MAG: acyltransferase [Candidatus Fournierella pullistercoris]|uniref:Acyltransferase n=1 Tax=Candidatus Allofournierella pullistercoris TaxID=2838597 RepID=A0A948T1U4_9FIRM|nr:acyltransferase [Candidatus Fournierella pullistercoris]
MLIILLCMIGVLMLVGTKVRPVGFFDDYISADKSQYIKGVFILMVFLSHSLTYIDRADLPAIDSYYLQFRFYMGQMIVAPFLFMSGYGVASSIRAKGKQYIQTMPHRRILMVLFQFNVALIFYWFVGTQLKGNVYDWKWILASIVGWNGFGNSTWYIFCILFLYLATWVSGYLFGDRLSSIVAGVTLFSVIFALVLHRVGREAYTYNTCLTYAAGMWYLIYQDKLEQWLWKSNLRYLAALLVTAGGYVLLHPYQENEWIHQLNSILFALALTLLTMKIQLGSKILHYCGRHLFSLYILQRLFMIVFDMTWVIEYLWMYMALSFITTFAISAIFDAVVPKLYRTLEQAGLAVWHSFVKERAN